MEKISTYNEIFVFVVEKLKIIHRPTHRKIWKLNQNLEEKNTRIVHSFHEFFTCSSLYHLRCRTSNVDTEIRENESLTRCNPFNPSSFEFLSNKICDEYRVEKGIEIWTIFLRILFIVNRGYERSLKDEQNM